MKAIVKSNAETGLWMQDVAEPSIGINDVLVKVLRTAICGTDLHIYNWDAWAQKTIAVPTVIGHEFVGEIVDIGSNVNDFTVGQIVSGEGHIVCGRCRNCMAGRRHLCAHSSGIGVNQQGAFAEYIALPMANVWVHKPGIDLEIAALFDPLGNAVHTALQFDLLGEDVLITGAGPIGALASAVCNYAGARHVVISDLNPNRLQRAKHLGASHTVDVSKDKIEDLRPEIDMVEGFDVGLEMSGNPQALDSMISNMAHGGKIAMLGIPAQPSMMDWNDVVFNMLTIKGIYGREMYETWYKMSVMIENGLDISPIISHRFSYMDFQQGFDAALSGDAGKVILDWETKND